MIITTIIGMARISYIMIRPVIVINYGDFDADSLILS